MLNCHEASHRTLEELEELLETNFKRGLLSSEAFRRLAIVGNNELSSIKKPNIWLKYLEQFKNPFIGLLLASAFISVCMGQYDDAVSITCALVIVVTVGFIQEYRSEKALEQMKQLLPQSCHCLRDGSMSMINARQLVPGDIVELQMGDRVPADMRLIRVCELVIDESSFTGETKPVFKSSSLVTDDIGDSINTEKKFDINICYLGTLVLGGNGSGVVVSTGTFSQFGEVFKLMEAQDPPRTPLQISMDQLGNHLSVYSLAVITIIILVGTLVRGRPLLEMFNVGVSLAVAAIPEGLPIVTTVTLALGVMRMAKRKAIVKRLPSVEALGCVDFICTDKTGTLTTNCMSVSEVYVVPSGSSLGDSDPLGMYQLFETAIMCNNSRLTSNGVVHGTPTEAALLREALKKDRTSPSLDYEYICRNYERINEIPFKPDQKYMSVDVRQNNGGGVVRHLKGACNKILDLCQDQSNRTLIMERSIDMSRRGLRVLALARGETSRNLRCLGLVGISDPLRPSAFQTVSDLREGGVGISIITGDSRETAVAIAEQVGLTGGDIVSGEHIDAISDQSLNVIVESVSVYYRVNPGHKVRIIKALQSAGHVVGMTGDGVNDAVAIKKADVGIAMCGADNNIASDVCKEAADVILLNNDLRTIVNAVEEGKCIFYNIRNFVRFQLSTSIAALVLVSLSTVLNLPSPLNAMQILWINIIMDGPPAQSLGLEPVDHDVLRQPPRRQNEPIITRNLLSNILLSAFIIVVGTLTVFRMNMVDGVITARDTTMTFTTFVFFDMFNALACRSQNKFIGLEVGLFENGFFCLAVGLSIVGQLAVIYLKPLQYVFQTEALSFNDMGFIVALSSTVFVVCETKKLLTRWYKRRKHGNLTQDWRTRRFRAKFIDKPSMSV